MESAKSVQGVVVTRAVVKTSAFHPRRSRVCFIHVTRVWQRFFGHNRLPPIGKVDKMGWDLHRINIINIVRKVRGCLYGPAYLGFNEV
jgi:hypothetical protein